MDNDGEWPGRHPDGSYHPVFLAQVRAEWAAARDHVAACAVALREAGRAWDEARRRERGACDRLTRILGEEYERVRRARVKENPAE
jgi:hypothetical protein